MNYTSRQENVARSNDVGPAFERIVDLKSAAPATMSGNGWHLNSVRRDVGLFHAIDTGPFDWVSKQAEDLREGLSTQLVIIDEGVLHIEQPARSVILSGGSIALLSGWITKKLFSETGFKGIIISLPLWWVPEHIYCASRSSYTIDPALFVSPVIGQLAKQIFDLDDVALHERALLIFAALLRETWPLSPPPASSIGGGRIGRIIAFVGRHYSDDSLSPQSAATALKCSLRTIHKCCAENGTSFNAILMEVRLAASEYMLSRDMRVSEVAYSAGFTSLSHFCRVFKARAGISANKYRRIYEGNTGSAAEWPR